MKRTYGLAAALIWGSILLSGCEGKEQKKDVSERFEQSKQEAQKAVEEAKQAVQSAQKKVLMSSRNLQ